MSRMTAVFLSLLVLTSGGLAQFPEKEDLKSLEVEAMSNNPEISAEIFRMNAAVERIPQFSALEDPQLTFKLMDIPGFQFNQAMYANIELMQMVRFPTKLLLRHDLALTQAEHAHHIHLEKVLDVLYRLKSAYAMLEFARTALELNRENQRLLRQIQTIVNTQYAAGKTSQQDVLKASIELALARSDESIRQQEVVSAESMMRAILNRPASAPIAILDSTAPIRVRQPLDTLLWYASMYRPMLVHDSLSVFEGSLNLDLMKDEYLPDFRFAVEYVRLPVDAQNRWSLSAGITIPFAPWTLAKASSRVQEAEAARSAAESQLIASRRMVESNIRDSYAQVRALETQASAFEESILPKTSQSLSATMQEYQSGRSSFLALLDSYRMYQETRLETAMVLMKRRQALAAMEQHVGVTQLSSIPYGEKE